MTTSRAMQDIFFFDSSRGISHTVVRTAHLEESSRSCHGRYANHFHQYARRSQRAAAKASPRQKQRISLRFIRSRRHCFRSMETESYSIQQQLGEVKQSQRTTSGRRSPHSSMPKTPTDLDQRITAGLMNTEREPPVTTPCCFAQRQIGHTASFFREEQEEGRCCQRKEVNHTK